MKIKPGKWLVVLLLPAVSSFVYIQYVNRNNTGMTGKQKVLNAFYPLLMGITKLAGKNTQEFVNKAGIRPALSFYSLQHPLSNGTAFGFNQLKGKKILLVNTASDCGYTGQYQQLQQLYEANKNRLLILAFPSNDFKEQEKGTDASIASFCQLNYGVSFPLMKKSIVIKGSQQNTVFQWLSDSRKNGWNNEPPAWNFSKYIVNEAGILTHYFGPSVSPLSIEVKNALK